MSYMMRCPNCGKHLKADLEKIGRRVGCNACREPFVHPGADELIARVKFADDPLTAPPRATAQGAEWVAVSERSAARSFVGWAAGLACVVVVAGLLVAFRNRETAEAAGDPSADEVAIAEFRDPADLPTVEEILAEDRSYALHLSSDVSDSGIQIDRTTSTVVLHYRKYQPTGLHVESAELRRLLEASRGASRMPTPLVARDKDDRPMLFLSNIYVTKPGLAGWMREVRDRLRVSPPFTITVAVEADGNVYLETTRDVAKASSERAGPPDRD